MEIGKEKITVFFSYGHDCEEIVLRIKNDLCRLGFEVWIDSVEIKTGNDWRERITSGILKSDTVMAFLSKHALRKNGVCLNELSIAVGCKYGHIKSVLLEPNIDHLIPPTISGIQYCDMSRWRVLQEKDPVAFANWYEEKLAEIVAVLSSKEAAEMNSQLKYLEQMLSPAMWQRRQQEVLQKQYIQRSEAEAKLGEWLQNRRGSRVYLLYGEPGSGKSSFLVNYHHFNHEAAAIAFCDWKKKSRDKLSEIIRSISFQLATKLPSYRAALVWYLENKVSTLQGSDEAELFRILLTEPLFGAIGMENETQLILVDSLNELDEKSGNALAEIIAEEGERLPSFIRFIITTRKGSAVSRYFPDSDSYEFSTSSESAIATIRQFYCVELEDILGNYKEEEADRILDLLSQRSEGNFLFAELCAKAINEGKLPLSDLNAVPRDLNGVYYRWFALLFPDDQIYLDKYYMPLSVLCSVEDPVPIDLLRRVMGWSVIEQNGFLRLLKDFLKCQENAFGQKTVTLFHSSMKRWLLSENAGWFTLESEAGLTLLQEQLVMLYEQEIITPYQCKLLISVLEKNGDNGLRRRVYGSSYFFKQYYELAKAYETVRGGYHKAILIYTHLEEICRGMPSEENSVFLKTVYPFAMGRCFCQIGDYNSAKRLLAENLPSLKEGLSREDLMETYYILGSVYDWLGERGLSVEIFTQLKDLATEMQDSSYLLRAIAGLVWGEHFTNIEGALAGLQRLSEQTKLNDVDRQMTELIMARVMLSTGRLDEALALYSRSLQSFDFSFRNDVRGYRKNRLMLIEILPACYDMSRFEKGVAIGVEIMQKIKNTGWLEECYCASWISLNYMGMGNVQSAERYLSKARYHLDSVNQSGASNWMTMHLSSIEAFLLAEKGQQEEAFEKHRQVAVMASRCNDAWVEGDACFEMAKAVLLYGIRGYEEAMPYIERLTQLATDSSLAHLLLKSAVIGILYHALTVGSITPEQKLTLANIETEKPLASTNYIDIFCIKAMIYSCVGERDMLNRVLYQLRERILRPEYKNRPSSRRIAESFYKKKESYVDFSVEYCDPFDNSENYWMRLEHLGRYLWACDECRQRECQRVADIACANGYGTFLLAQAAGQAFGFDRSDEYIAKAKKQDNLTYISCDLDTLPIEQYSACFDLIASFETLEHVKDPDRLIRLFATMLSPGGVLLLSFPNSRYEQVDEYGLNRVEYHLHIFELEQVIEKLRASGFKITAVMGQSRCNELWNQEQRDIQEGRTGAEVLEKLHQKSRAELEEEARRVAIPDSIAVDSSYSYILLCEKT